MVVVTEFLILNCNYIILCSVTCSRVIKTCSRVMKKFHALSMIVSKTILSTFFIISYSSYLFHC